MISLLVPLILAAATQADVAPIQEGPPTSTLVELYPTIRSGVVQVISGVSTGSGFIVNDDLLGHVIVTNAHVLDPGQNLSVILGDSVRVPAKPLATDEQADLALLVANVELCPSCHALELLPAESGRPVPGTPVYAIGYPLGLGSVLSAGIITGRTARLLLSDVDINEGNSGGPLVDGHGYAVGVNTFVLPSRAGPGVSGVVDGALVRELLSSTRANASANEPPAPSSEVLPMLDLPPYPIEELLAAGDSVEFKQYERFGDLESQDFEISIFTPVSLMALYREQERQVSERRRKREKERNVLRLAWYNERSEFRQWHEDLGDITQPYVVIRISPKTGRTTGNIFEEVLTGLAGAVTAAATGSPYMVTNVRQEYEFKGDLAGVSFFRVDSVDTNSDPYKVWRDSIQPLLGGTRPIRVFISGQLIEFRDVAFGGVYVLHPAEFRPDSNGIPPHIFLRFRDLTNDPEEDDELYELSPRVAARIWNDFRPYFANTLGETAPLAEMDVDNLEWMCRPNWRGCSHL